MFGKLKRGMYDATDKPIRILDRIIVGLIGSTVFLTLLFANSTIF